MFRHKIIHVDNHGPNGNRANYTLDKTKKLSNI